jgi:hypothetical protein
MPSPQSSPQGEESTGRGCLGNRGRETVREASGEGSSFMGKQNGSVEHPAVSLLNSRQEEL